MGYLRLLILLLLFVPVTAYGASIQVELSYTIDETGNSPGPYGATADRSWAIFDSDDQTSSGGTNGPLPVAPHLMALAIYADGQQVANIIDNPGHRVTPYISIDTTVNPRPKLTLKTVYLWSPWLAGAAIAQGDNISVFLRWGANMPASPNLNGRWTCTRAGVTGSAEPNWSSAGRVTFDNGYRYFFDSKNRLLGGGAVVDNGNGTTVNIQLNNHRFIAGSSVTISGTVNYNGTFTLPVQTLGDANNLEITHAYIAETFSSSAEIHLTAGEAIDNGDGTVTLPIPSHGFVAGDSVTLSGSSKYISSPYLLPPQTLGDADHLVITAAYTAEVMSGSGYAYPTNGTVVDNGDGTVTIPATAHGLAAGDVIDIFDTVNYNGTYTLPAQTLGDADHLVITHAYIAETIGPYPWARKRLQDPDTAGAEWQYVTGGTNAWWSTPNGRTIITDRGDGRARRSGIYFIKRYQ